MMDDTPFYEYATNENKLIMHQDEWNARIPCFNFRIIPLGVVMLYFHVLSRRFRILVAFSAVRSEQRFGQNSYAAGVVRFSELGIVPLLEVVF